mmetsp:Transcript_44778/g.132235  ORF Transcript_44778/g.132235 Transcript_44778/m.132235 type:complete len:211 (+) Transcript_44778:2964-3596(+)
MNTTSCGFILPPSAATSSGGGLRESCSLTSNSGGFSVWASWIGSMFERKNLSDVTIVLAMPATRISLMNSTYARHAGAPLETLSTSLDAASKWWISLPPSVISFCRASSCFAWSAMNALTSYVLGDGRTSSGLEDHFCSTTSMAFMLLFISARLECASETRAIASSMNADLSGSGESQVRRCSPRESTLSISFICALSSGFSTGSIVRSM